MQSLLLILAVMFGALAVPASSQTLSQLAKQQGCTSAPIVVDGTDLYKCQTQSATSYFSGPASAYSAGPPGKKSPSLGARTPTPANFPRVDGNVQRERDDVRKRVLTEELAAETRMLAEVEGALKSGSAPAPDETVTSPKYVERIAKLRQAVGHHQRNIQALNKELERSK